MRISLRDDVPLRWSSREEYSAHWPLPSTDGWVTNRVTPGRIILGELGDIESGVRQLIRNRPLEVTEVELPSGQMLGRTGGPPRLAAPREHGRRCPRQRAGW
jgi:hypothetical protein